MQEVKVDKKVITDRDFTPEGVDPQVLVQAAEDMELLNALKEVREKLSDPAYAPYVRKSSLKALMQHIEDLHEHNKKLIEVVVAMAVEADKALADE